MPQSDNQSRAKRKEETKRNIDQINEDYQKYVLRQSRDNLGKNLDGNSHYENGTDSISSAGLGVAYFGGSSNSNYSRSTRNSEQLLASHERYPPYFGNETGLSDEIDMLSFRNNEMRFSQSHSAEKKSMKSTNALQQLLDAQQLKVKSQLIERENRRMEAEVLYLQKNLLSEIEEHESKHRFRVQKIMHALEMARKKINKSFLQQSFAQILDYSNEQFRQAEEVYQQNQQTKLLAVWNGWKNYMLDIKVNALRFLVKEKMLSTEKVYERQSIQYHNKKLKAKSFVGWYYSFVQHKRESLIDPVQQFKQNGLDPNIQSQSNDTPKTAIKQDVVRSNHIINDNQMNGKQVEHQQNNQNEKKTCISDRIPQYQLNQTHRSAEFNRLFTYLNKNSDLNPLVPTNSRTSIQYGGGFAGSDDISILDAPINSQLDCGREQQQVEDNLFLNTSKKINEDTSKPIQKPLTVSQLTGGPNKPPRGNSTQKPTISSQQKQTSIPFNAKAQQQKKINDSKKDNKTSILNSPSQSMSVHANNKRNQNDNTKNPQQQSRSHSVGIKSKCDPILESSSKNEVNLQNEQDAKKCENDNNHYNTNVSVDTRKDTDQSMECSSKSFFQETCSSSLKRARVGSAQKPNNNTINKISNIFSLYHPTDSKNIRGSSNILNGSRVEEPIKEEVVDEYNPICFENKLRQPDVIPVLAGNSNTNVDVSLQRSSEKKSQAGRSSLLLNNSGYSSTSATANNSQKEAEEKKLKEIEKRAYERKKKLEDLKSKQLEWKKQQENESEQAKARELEKERNAYNKEFIEFQAIKRAQKNAKRSPEEIKAEDEIHLLKAESFYRKCLQKRVYSILVENQESHGKLEAALALATNKLLTAGFLAFLGGRSRQKVGEHNVNIIKAEAFYDQILKKRAISLLKRNAILGKVASKKMKRSHEDLLMRTAFAGLFSQIRAKSEVEEDVSHVVIQFRKVVLQERGFRGWRQLMKESSLNKSEQSDSTSLGQ